jgi:hypothetical protein
LNLKASGKDQGLYNISGLNVEHNHPITEAAYLVHPINRKVPEELKGLVKDMLETGSKVNLITKKNFFF